MNEAKEKKNKFIKKVNKSIQIDSNRFVDCRCKIHNAFVSIRMNMHIRIYISIQNSFQINNVLYKIISPY